MAKSQNPTARITKKPLFFWVFHGNLKLQFILLAIIILIVFARVLPLEMQKRIINDAIALRDIDSLLVYSAIYIVAITAASGLKLAINYLQAIIGERSMTAMRQDLYNHILTLPLGFFKTTQPGMIVSSLITELSAAGTFAGSAFAVPVTNVLTLLSFAGYLFWLNYKLAAATLLIYPLVVTILPILQKKANIANKKRIDLSRLVSSQIAESISGIHEIQVHGANNQENTKFEQLTQKLQEIRINWSLVKFGIKTANNYFVGLGPFVVFVFGGYLVMHGQLELGAMVAFLSAQEKLFDPWKELIDFYQDYQDASVRYRRTMEHFDFAPEFDMQNDVANNAEITGNINIRNLVYETPEGLRLLDNVSFSLAAGEHLAVVGFSGSGKSTLIQCIAKMFPYTAGSIQLDGHEVNELGKKEVARSIGYISQNPFIFTGTLEQNLIYSVQAAAPENPAIDLDRMILVLQQAGLFVDVMRFGLDSTINSTDVESAEKIVKIRKSFQAKFGKRLDRYVEFYDTSLYHDNSTVAENIIFGTSESQDFSFDSLPDKIKIRNFLSEQKLLLSLQELGVDIAEQAVDILAGVDSVDLFFEKSPVRADQLNKCKAILERLRKSDIHHLSSRAQNFLLSIALQFTPSIHTMIRLPKALMEQIIKARHNFPAWCESNAPELLRFYNQDSYIHGQSILNNIFFGRVRPGLPQAQEALNQAIMHLLVEEDFLERIAAIGMNYQVGTMGDRLSGGQRQKLAIARVLLKQPNLILMDEATSALDNKSQNRIQRLMTSRWKGKRTVLAVVHRLDIINTFDKIAVMKSGKLVEFGTYDDLTAQKGLLYELIYGKK